MRLRIPIVCSVLAATVLGVPVGAAGVTGSAGAAGTGIAGAVAASAPAATKAPVRWVDVSVATLWTSPSAPRAVDRAAVANPADPVAWLRGMTLAERKALNGRVDTQVLYGDEVLVLQSSGKWSKVAVPGQPSPRLAAGYPGWIPTAQLTDRAPADTSQTATVKRRTARLYRDAALTKRAMRVSYGTDLPVRSVGRSVVEVVDLQGRRLFVARSKVRVAATGGAVRPTSARATGKALVAEARRFLGLKYLWGGASGFGFDCSGFTHTVHRQLGITIPRDARPQFAAGQPVSRKALRPGDLVFFRNSSGIHHVGMYVGDGRMIHSPRTGKPVAVVSLRSQPWAREFAGGRRFTG
ncbi:MAG: C40 family peptidase [Candidatus Nanopelagicales bacterium]